MSAISIDADGGDSTTKKSGGTTAGSTPAGSQNIGGAGPTVPGSLARENSTFLSVSLLEFGAKFALI